MNKIRLVTLTILVLLCGLPGPQYASAQELEPRAFANTPVGLNFLLLGYRYIDGNVALNTTLPVEDAEVRSHSCQLALIMTHGPIRAFRWR